jgi:hypothetical protein
MLNPLTLESGDPDEIKLLNHRSMAAVPSGK